MVLESLPNGKNSSRMCFFIKVQPPNRSSNETRPEFPQPKVFVIGRGHESDIRISDISVSRVHACIEYRDGAFLLYDKVSKFGTLVKSKGNLCLVI